MQKDDILTTARKLATDQQAPFVMGTVSPDGSPHVFWMGALVFEEPFTLYMETFTDSRKVSHIKNNPQVEVLLSKHDFTQLLTISGEAEMVADDAKKRDIYDKISASAEYFKGPDDPEFGVIRMKTTQLRLRVSQDQREPFVATI